MDTTDTNDIRHIARSYWTAVIDRFTQLKEQLNVLTNLRRKLLQIFFQAGEASLR